MEQYQRNHPDATFTIGINHLADRRVEVGEYEYTILTNINYILGVSIWY
jgi:hypothetical protein